MTAVRPRRRGAPVVGYFGDDGNVRAVLVRCPFCRGRHQHAYAPDIGHASPWCGTPALYELVWAEPSQEDMQ